MTYVKSMDVTDYLTLYKESLKVHIFATARVCDIFDLLFFYNNKYYVCLRLRDLRKKIFAFLYFYLRN